ncbi:MAG: CDP-diacylglycerol--glycerol-3-phosphate 3-phosphatidyltransferase [Fusobacteria bacterium]|nr:CDP-diacylglycerol--glycerol-3-phosphate 3-phosphatidyltransferase [Fusobacteriota bacterium]
MNLPTKITVFRLLLIPVFIITYYIQDTGYLISGAIFILASLTDLLDGYLARKRNETTNLGAFLDPVADKVLVTSALVLLAVAGIVPSWSVILIIGREILINGFRLIAIEKGIVISASYLGKIKTTTQLLSIIILIFSPISSWLLLAGIIIYWIAVITTVLSGFEYLYQGRDLLSE